VARSILFISQYGTVNLSSLPVISIDGRTPPGQTSSALAPAPEPALSTPSSEHDVFAAIERLAELHVKGILTDDEYARKKSELLSCL